MTATEGRAESSEGLEREEPPQRGGASEAPQECEGRPLCRAGQAGPNRCQLRTHSAHTHTSAPRRAAAEQPSAPEPAPGTSRGPGATAMDIPPLAGKISVLSLCALPVSYGLNYVSALSQCVPGGAGRPPGGRRGRKGGRA